MMQKLEGFGAKRLTGQINISGSKNASLPILAATLLSNKKVYLKNLSQTKHIVLSRALLRSIWISGNPDFWISVSPEIQISRNPDSQKSRCSEIQVFVQSMCKSEKYGNMKLV